MTFSSFFKMFTLSFLHVRGGLKQKIWYEKHEMSLKVIGREGAKEEHEAKEMSVVGGDSQAVDAMLLENTMG